MTKRNFNITNADDQTIAKYYDGGDHAFYAQTMFPNHSMDAIELLRAGKMFAIISEEHGGVIGYAIEEVADDLATVLNLHTIERTKIEFKETFEPTGSEYMQYTGMKFKIIRQMEPGKEYDQEEGNERMYLIELESGITVEAFDCEVEM